MKRPSRRLHPFKILVLILYGSYEGVVWVDASTVKMRLGPMSRLFHVSSHRFREYLEDLARMRYIGGLELTWGQATFRVMPPPVGRVR